MIENRDVQKDLEQLDSLLKEQGISRRDAMKIMGLGGATFVLGTTQAQASTQDNSSQAKGKIVIIGGGLAGMATAARLTHTLINPDITIIEPASNSSSYQPGQTLVAAGLWTRSDILYKRDDFIPNGNKIIKEKAIEFDPDNNTIKTEQGTVVTYDFLVIAAGVTLNYSAIKGLEDVGELYSTGNNKDAIKALTSKGVSSIYTADGAEQSWMNMEAFISRAKKVEKVKGLFTHPNTPVKGESASQNIMFLANARLNEAGAKVRANADLHFYSNSETLSEIKDYHSAIEEQFEKRNMNYTYKHNLVEIKNGLAIFDDNNQSKEIYDEDLKKNIHTRVEKEFDFIHLTPPMKAPDEIANSKLGSEKGWVPVNKETLQHENFPNVFALGDIANIPMGKTSGSVKKQYKVVVNNIISMMEKGEIPVSNLKYDGYTISPIITDIGKVMLAEFNWASQETGSGKNAAITSLVDPTKERYIWWLLKLYIQRPITVYGLLAGKA